MDSCINYLIVTVTKIDSQIEERDVSQACSERKLSKNNLLCILSGSNQIASQCMLTDRSVITFAVLVLPHTTNSCLARNTEGHMWKNMRYLHLENINLQQTVVLCFHYGIPGCSLKQFLIFKSFTSNFYLFWY